jgi:hypothetical protein
MWEKYTDKSVLCLCDIELKWNQRTIHLNDKLPFRTFQQIKLSLLDKNTYALYVENVHFTSFMLDK